MGGQPLLLAAASLVQKNQQGVRDGAAALLHTTAVKMVTQIVTQAVVPTARKTATMAAEEADTRAAPKTSVTAAGMQLQ